MLSVISVGLPLLVAILAGEGVKATSCNVTSPCPLSAPCCSEYGFCGKGHFCLGGCNPFSSRSLDSCKPAPVCKDAEYVFSDNSRILSNATYFEGDATEYDWVLDQGKIFNTNSTGGELALTLTEKNGGTKISSTRYVHYGTITARLKTSRWNGVITAFITMSDIKDEIDWEFAGSATTEGQSNYFWQGFIPEKHNGGVHGELSDTYSNYHDFTIDWQPDTLSWAIDGKVVRTIKRSDTIDPATGIVRYPTTPSRIQLSIWPAGIPGSAAGTVEWAGGMIDWNHPDYKDAGQFYILVKSVSVKCSNLPSLVSSSNSTAANITSYVYTGNGTNGTPALAYTNRSTDLNGVGRGMNLLGVEGGKWQLAVLGLTGLFVTASQVVLGL
ncbi:hypothetical protein H1R20_g4047, partial [Candolleomyces eurysporus]